MKKFLKKTDIILIGILLLTLIVFAAVNIALPYIAADFYFILFFYIICLGIIVGLTVWLVFRIKKQFKNYLADNYSIKKNGNSSFSPNGYSNINPDDFFANNFSSTMDFVFSVSKIWAGFGKQKYSPPRNSPELISRLKHSDKASEVLSLAGQLRLADNIKMGYLPTSVIKPLFIAVYDVLMRFPCLKSGFGFLCGMNELLIYLNGLSGISPVQIDNVKRRVLKAMTGKTIRAMAFQIGHTIGIAINDKIYGDPINAARDQTNLLAEVSNGVFPKSCKTFKAIVDHEIGHIFDFVLNISTTKELSDFLSKIQKKDIEKELGTYALTDFPDKRELVAVAYSDKQNSKAPSRISIKVCELIETSYQKKFKVS